MKGRLLALALGGALTLASAHAQTEVRNDDRRYEVAVVGCQAYTDVDGLRHAFVALRLHSRASVPLSLVCQEKNVAAHDDGGTRYMGTVQGALGTRDAVRVKKAFVLRPGEVATALLHLSTPERPKREPGTTLAVDLPLADVATDREGKAAFGPTRLLRLSGLAPAEYAPRPDAADKGLPRVVEGPLSARVVSADVRASPQDAGDRLDLTIEVTNLSAEPVFLGTGSFVAPVMDAYGRRYGWTGEGGSSSRETGIGADWNAVVKPSFLLEPDESRTYREECWGHVARIPAREALGVYLGLSTMKRGADRKYRRDQDYVLSFLYVRPTGRSPVPLGKVGND